MYKGKWCTVDTLNAQRNLPIINTPQRAPPRVTNKRLRIVSFNTGPLSSASYDELMLWMSDFVHTLDLVLIQECGRPSDVEYSTDDWHIVYSGAGHKGQGVMVCVNRRLCPMAEAIRRRSVIPGRLLHVRVTPPRAGCSIDVCCVYQYVWSPKCQTTSLTQKRDSVWQALSLLITQTPVRNTLICAGDFNTTLHSSTNWVGPAVRPPKTRPVDQDRFQQLVETHDLIATNTWTTAAGAHTFSPHQGCTQLDYILRRRACVDHQARHACPEHNMSLFAWQQGGRHFPVFGSLPLRTYQGSRRRVDAKSNSATAISYDKEALCCATQHHTEDAQRLQHVVHHLLDTHCPATPEELNNLLTQAMEDVFPKKPGPRPAPAKAWQCGEVQAPIREMWLHHRKARIAIQGWSSFGTLQALKHHYNEQHQASLPLTGSHFNRWRHSIQGLPTCAHCGHAFGSWGDLQRHIEGRLCAQMWKVHTQQTRRTSASTTSALCLPTSQQPRPMLYNETLRAMLRKQGWHHALDHFSEISHLKNHCGLRGQWVVDSQHLQTHLRRIHLLEWQKCSSQVSIKCKLLARSIISPCRWCGTFLKRPAPHANKCAVAFQLCLLSEILGCQDGAGRSAVIRWLSSTAATSCPDDGGSPGAAPRELGTSAGPGVPEHTGSQVHRHATKEPAHPGAHASGLGKKEATGSGTTISSPPRPSRAGPMGEPLDNRGLLLKAFECGARPLRERSLVNGNPADLEARRSATAHGRGHNTCLDDEELSGERLGGIADVPGDGSPATTTPGRQDATSPNLAGRSDAFPSAADRGATPGSSGGSHQSCCAEAQRLAFPRRGLALHEVGQSEGGARSGHPTCDDESRLISSGPDRDPHVPGAIPGGVASQVPGDTSPDGRDAGARCHLSFRNITAACIRRRPVSHPESLARVGVFADRWPPDQASPTGDTAGAYKAALTSALLNPSNLCYENSFALSYAWCLAACEGDLCSFLGRSWEAFRVLLQRSITPFQLTGLLSWRILLQGWSDITSQHDAAEFADFCPGQTAANPLFWDVGSLACAGGQVGEKI